jgi:hypothetical protein
MTALLASGALHLMPDMLTGGYSPSRLAAGTLYWGANGLAIYAVLAAPARWPGLMRRLRIGDSVAWSVAGVILTSAFYAVLHGALESSDTWGGLADYGARLLAMRL